MKKISLCTFNVENLFVFLENYSGEDLNLVSEKSWQSFTYGMTPNKPLAKILSLAKAILDINADIYLLCEVGGRTSLENFNRHFLQNRYLVFHEESNSPRGIDLAYLVKKDLPFHYQ